MSNYLDELNESQREAVTYVDGPSLVIAGAGSGKTRVLTYKVAQLIREGYAPNSILVLTFTNKAAKEMKSRIVDMVGTQSARYVAMGTFHSQFSRILKDNHEYVGLTKDFTVYDTADSKNLIKSNGGTGPVKSGNLIFSRCQILRNFIRKMRFSL